MAVVKAINNKNQTGGGMAFSITYASKDKKLFSLTERNW